MKRRPSRTGRAGVLSAVVITCAFGIFCAGAFAQLNPGGDPGAFDTEPKPFAMFGPHGVFVPGPFPAPPFTGSGVDFEGFPEGTLIGNQYVGLGVTFTQDDAGTPMIDNKPFLFAFESASGDGVLTGSTTGGAPFPTVAGLVAEFTHPAKRAGAFMSDTAPLGDYEVTAFDEDGLVIDTVTVLASDFPIISDGCSDAPFTGTGCGVFVGFDTGARIISKIQFGPSNAFGDAFAIDDLVFAITGIGDIKPTPFVPTPSANGRGIAFDGWNTLYYSTTLDPNIYMATPAGVSLGPIPNPGRTFTCGALEFHPPSGNLMCATYDSTGTGGPGTADFWWINPVTGVASLMFNSNAFGGLDGNTCLSPFFGYMDGLSWDASDNTLWLSDDVSKTLYHVGMNGAFIASFSTPVRPGATQPGCNSGIEVVAGGFLELVLLPFDDGASGVGHIVKVSKDDPSGDVLVAFPVAPLIEDLDFDANTFAPRAVLWSNEAGTNIIKAYDVQVTRTIGYWKNHPAADYDGTSFLPIDLGISDFDYLACRTAVDDDDVYEILKAHKGQDAAPRLMAQLLAAELNLAMGDVPLSDMDAIAPVIDAAHELLGRNDCDPDTDKKGDDRSEALFLHDALDSFNSKYSP